MSDYDQQIESENAHHLAQRLIDDIRQAYRDWVASGRVKRVVLMTALREIEEAARGLRDDKEKDTD